MSARKIVLYEWVLMEVSLLIQKNSSRLKVEQRPIHTISQLIILLTELII